ncbi:MarR family winged helix-turn-helix transcriptional regulator [Microbispora sp. H13382]|uniref:MarR family winged helix-turn-helix transcriptional regulator n=1 Tax=Microbispora sp. H13382 TaxID=2729112 RepID=UPI001601C38D|nr:MarR family transcriptional regulator [Microbispora sp. H13382]
MSAEIAEETDPALEEDAWSVEDASLALVEMTLTAVTRGAGLSVTQLRVLLAVDRHGPLNLSGLADLLGMSVSATGRLVARLHTAGLLTRLLSPHSRREVSIDVTETGRRSLERVRAARRGHIAAALRRLPPDSRRTLARTLREFTAAASDGPGAGGHD